MAKKFENFLPMNTPIIYVIWTVYPKQVLITYFIYQIAVNLHIGTFDLLGSFNENVHNKMVIHHDYESLYAERKQIYEQMSFHSADIWMVFLQYEC